MDDGQAGVGASHYFGILPLAKASTYQVGDRLAERSVGVHGDGDGRSVQILGQVYRGSHTCITAPLAVS